MELDDVLEMCVGRASEEVFVKWYEDVLRLAIVVFRLGGAVDVAFTVVVRTMVVVFTAGREVV